MKINLPCAIVRDLLPSYAEGLTEAETTEAVKAHLDGCSNCAARYAAMTGGEAAEQADTGKEVDYLKTVRKKNQTKIMLAVVLAVALMLWAMAVKAFLIGSPCDGSGVLFDQTPFVYEDAMFYTFYSTDSGKALFHWNTEMQDGVVNITAREALVSPFHKSGSYTMTVPLKNVREIYLFGKLVWRDMAIAPEITDLLKFRVPYVGNAAAVGALVDQLLASSADCKWMPRHTLELQTAQEPYGLTIRYEGTLNDTQRVAADQISMLALALIDNLGSASWTAPEGGGTRPVFSSGELSLDIANKRIQRLTGEFNENRGTDWDIRESIKDYAQDTYTLQQLCMLIGFRL